MTLLDRLTPRQQEVFELMAQGKSNQQIAQSLGTSPNTVKLQVSAILRRVGARSRLEALHRVGGRLSAGTGLETSTEASLRRIEEKLDLLLATNERNI